MRALTSSAQWLCSSAHRKPKTTIFLERSAPFLADANRLFHVDWELAVWNKNCWLSKTDSLLTPWKYGTDDIAHVGTTNLQAVHFLKRNIAFERTLAKNISGRYPTLDVSLTTQLPTGRLYTCERTNPRCLARTGAVCVRPTARRMEIWKDTRRWSTYLKEPVACFSNDGEPHGALGHRQLAALVPCCGPSQLPELLGHGQKKCHGH